MLLKISLLCCLAVLALADDPVNLPSDTNAIPIETRVEHSVSFETSHKRPESLGDDAFQTSHKISPQIESENLQNDMVGDFNAIQSTMNLLPTKERPELNPVLSALINEDVMKSIEAKRAIEQEELEIVQAEADKALAEEKEKKKELEAESDVTVEKSTEATVAVLTTIAPVKKDTIDDDIVGFVDQPINLDAAGSENNKKSRIEIKKGPNGQDYEYEYVYYYEDEDNADKVKPAEDKDTRGKSRYTNIERSTSATPSDNSLVKGKAKGRASAASDSEDIEPERLPTNTRFPSRGKNIEVQPTPPLDSIENAAEKKKISVKRPSLELVDSETFNTDEKQVKSARNGDTETKSNLALEQDLAESVAERLAAELKSAKNKEETGVTDAAEEDVESTTPAMEKAAFDLYAILANENYNMDMTTDADTDVTTLIPDTTNPDDENLTTIVAEESTSTTTTTTTTTTTEAPTTTTTTTTTTTAPPTLFGGRKGLPAGGRNRFKLKQGGAATTTTTTTEAPEASEPPKTGRNRFSRPSIGGRTRPTARTTAAPAPSDAQEEEVVAKEVKPISSGFSRGKPRNRFNLRGSTTTTEKPSEEAGEGGQEEEVSSTTARTLRNRPTLRGRGSRTTTTKAPATEEKESTDGEANTEEKSVPAPASPVKPSRFHRPGGNRLLPRTKLGRTTEAPAADDSTPESSNSNDVKAEADEHADKTDVESTSTAGGLNRLKTRPRLNASHKTDKPKAAPAPIAPRKINPLLAKRRLQLGPSTTEAAPADEESSPAGEETESKDDTSASSGEDSETTEATETTTKQARGLGLLGQRRKLPVRKPGTLL